MKKSIITLLLGTLACMPASAALLVQYTFNGNDNNQITTTNYTASGTISRVGLASAVYATDPVTSGAFEGSSYLGTAGSTLTNASLTKPDTNVASGSLLHYVEFNITPDSGFELNLNHLDIILLGSSNTGAYGNLTLFGRLDYRIGAGSFINAGSQSSDDGVANHTRRATERQYTLGLSGVTDAVTLRFYINDQAGGGTAIVGIDNIRLDGSVVAIPEPSTYALLAGGLAALFWLRRRSA